MLGCLNPYVASIVTSWSSAAAPPVDRRGVAGAHAAASVMLLERDRFPRFHIGESLLASVNDVLEAIGAAELIRREGFPQKWGATFMTPDGRVERFADFAVSSEVPQPQTWQVPREQFDDLLLRHAAVGRRRARGAARHRHRVRRRWRGDPQRAHRNGRDQAPRTRARTHQRFAPGAHRCVGPRLLAHRFDLRVDEPGSRQRRGVLPLRRRARAEKDDGPAISAWWRAPTSAGSG